MWLAAWWVYMWVCVHKQISEWNRGDMSKSFKSSLTAGLFITLRIINEALSFDAFKLPLLYLISAYIYTHAHTILSICCRPRKRTFFDCLCWEIGICIGNKSSSSALNFLHFKINSANFYVHAGKFGVVHVNTTATPPPTTITNNNYTLCQRLNGGATGSNVTSKFQWNWP